MFFLPPPHKITSSILWSISLIAEIITWEVNSVKVAAPSSIDIFSGKEKLKYCVSNDCIDPDLKVVFFFFKIYQKIAQCI